MSFNCFMAMKQAYQPYQFWERLHLDPSVCFFVNGHPSNSSPVTGGEFFHVLRWIHLKKLCILQVLQSLCFGKLTWTQCSNMSYSKLKADPMVLWFLIKGKIHREILHLFYKGFEGPTAWTRCWKLQRVQRQLVKYMLKLGVSDVLGEQWRKFWLIVLLGIIISHYKDPYEPSSMKGWHKGFEGCSDGDGSVEKVNGFERWIVFSKVQQC